MRGAQQLRRQAMKRTTGGALCCASHGLSLLITAHGPEGPFITPYERGLPGQVWRDSEDTPWREDEALMDERFLAVRVRGSPCFRRAPMRGC